MIREQPYLTSDQVLKLPAPQLTVLIVEDDETQVKLLSLFLQRIGYATLAAKNGQSALQQLAQTDVDIMLLDLHLPGMNGFETCIEVRKRSSLPILILSALSQVEKIVYSLEIGADGYITKPFSLRELEARLQAVTHRLPKLQECSTLPNL